METTKETPALPERLTLETFIPSVRRSEVVLRLALDRYNSHAALEAEVERLRDQAARAAARVLELADSAQAFHDSDESACARDSHGEDCDCEFFVQYVPLADEKPTCIHVRTFHAMRRALSSTEVSK